MRIVLLGYNGAGKSSSGNTILAKPAFDLKRSITSVIREGDVSGRHITVVDTPGRRRNVQTKYTPRLYKDEILLSPSLCPPGPHVFLLVIRVDVSFTDVYRRAVEEHVAYLGLNIWDHIIVLFTFGDWLGDRSIEQFIESEGEPLQWIIDKCGNRYHVFNNMSKDDINQVTELLKKIEEMVAGNKGCCYEINQQTLQEVKERRMLAEERAKQLKDKVQRYRNELKHSVSGVPELSEMRLVLCKFGGTEDSSSGNTILDRREEQNPKERREVAGRQLIVVDTPGFWRQYPVGKTLEDAKLNILRSIKECFPGPHAFFLVLDFDCSFAEEEKSAVQKIMEPLGEEVWNHTMVLFTGGDQLSNTPIELFIASKSDAFLWLIEKCGNRYHVLDNNLGDGPQVTELLEEIEEMVSGNKGRHYEIDEETLERVEREVTVSMRGALSMDHLEQFNEGFSDTTETSSAYISEESHEPTEHNLFSSLHSKMDILDCIPESDGELDSD